MSYNRYDLFLYIANRIVANIPSHSVRLAFYKHVAGFEIGEGSSIHMEAWIEHYGNFMMGKNSTINQRCRIDNRGGITIGDNVSISPEVCILTTDHDLKSPGFEGRKSPVAIANYVFIGTRATILKGVTLGEGCAVAAGTIVAKDVTPYTIVAGNPVRVIGERPIGLTYGVEYRRWLF